MVIGEVMARAIPSVRAEALLQQSLPSLFLGGRPFFRWPSFKEDAASRPQNSTAECLPMQLDLTFCAVQPL